MNAKGELEGSGKTKECLKGEKVERERERREEEGKLK